MRYALLLVFACVATAGCDKSESEARRERLRREAAIEAVDAETPVEASDQYGRVVELASVLSADETKAVLAAYAELMQASERFDSSDWKLVEALMRRQLLEDVISRIPEGVLVNERAKLQELVDILQKFVEQGDSGIFRSATNKSLSEMHETLRDLTGGSIVFYDDPDLCSDIMWVAIKCALPLDDQDAMPEALSLAARILPGQESTGAARRAELRRLIDITFSVWQHYAAIGEEDEDEKEDDSIDVQSV